MVSFDEFAQHVEDVLADELKALLEPIVDEFFATGVLELPEVVDLISTLDKSGARIVNNVVLALLKDAARESVEKIFIKKYGPPKQFQGTDKIKIDIINAILNRVIGNVVESLNLVLATTLTGPLGPLAALLASIYEELFIEQLFLYNGPAILEAFSVLEEAPKTISAGLNDPNIADPIRIDVNVDNQQLGSAITNSIDLSGWTEKEIQIWRDSGYQTTAPMQRAAIANAQASIQKTQQAVQQIAQQQRPLVNTTPLLSGVRDNPFEDWDYPSWQDDEDFHQQVRYRQEEGDFIDVLNTNLY